MGRTFEEDSVISGTNNVELEYLQKYSHTEHPLCERVLRAGRAFVTSYPDSSHLPVDSVLARHTIT